MCQGRGGGGSGGSVSRDVDATAESNGVGRRDVGAVQSVVIAATKGQGQD
jgi:hypothetical protein